MDTDQLYEITLINVETNNQITKTNINSKTNWRQDREENKVTLF